MAHAVRPGIAPSLLLSMPQLVDPNFHRTVVLLCEHNADGAFGLIINRPTFGCAKSVLVGKYEEPGAGRGAWTPLVDKGETVGAALRTKDRVQPIYVSPGHLMDVESAVALTLRCHGGYRQPEPTRRAHLLVNALRRGERAPTSEDGPRREDEGQGRLGF